MHFPIRSLVAAAAVTTLLSCGGGSGSSGPPPVLMIEKWTPSGDNQTDTAGQTLPQVLRVKATTDGALTAGVTVNFSGGTLGTPSMVTGADGIATSTWTLSGIAGTQLVTATAAGAAGSPLTFHATAVPGAASALQKNAGDSQVAQVNAFFAGHMIVRVVDQFGNGLAGKWVYWSKTGPVILVSDSIITGDFGYSEQIVTAGATSGPATVTATVAGLIGSPRVFTATVVPGTTTVTVSSNAFTDSVVTISAGSAVRWTWTSGSHSVTSNGVPSFTGSSIEATGYILGPIVFATPGTYLYHCSVHAGMTGKIIVN